MYSAVVVQEILQRRRQHWRWGEQWLAIRSWQWQLRGSSKLILPQLHEKLPKNSMLTILQSFSFWSKLERWKSPKVGASWADHKSKKSLFWSVFSYSTQQWKISLSDCDVWWKVNQWQPAQWLNWEEVLKNFPKPNLHQKKVMVIVWWSSLLPIGSTTVFWTLVKPLHLRSMLSKSMRCTENCNACNRHWSTERNQFPMTMPIHTLHNQCLKSGANWPIKFCLIYHICPTSHQLIITSLSNILQGKCFHNQ